MAKRKTTPIEVGRPVDGGSKGKYRSTTLLPALRLFIHARNEAINLGFTDNGGAIHSVERILDILCLRVKYPTLSHINNLKQDPTAERSVGAHQAMLLGESVFIEHVMPQREFAREVIGIINAGATDNDVLHHIRERYRLVLLSKDETSLLNRLNRSRITPDRIADAGIVVYVENLHAVVS